MARSRTRLRVPPYASLFRSHLAHSGEISAPTAVDSNRRSGLAITQFAGRVMADTIVAKKAGPDSKVAITPAHFYLFPHRVEAKGPTVPAARPTDSKRKTRRRRR